LQMQTINRRIFEIGSYLYFIGIFKLQNAILFSVAVFFTYFFF
jgi:hypothetical protein